MSDAQMDVDQPEEVPPGEAPVEVPPPALADMQIDKQSEMTEEKSSTAETAAHPVLFMASSFGMKLPPPEYSGIKPSTEASDTGVKSEPPTLIDETSERPDTNTELSGPPKLEKKPPLLDRPPLLDKPPVLEKKPLLDTPPLLEKKPLLETPTVKPRQSRITGPISLDEGEMDRDRRPRGPPRGRRGPGWDRDDYDDDDDDGRGDRRRRPRHGKYKYPDDFDDEDFEEDYDGPPDDDYYNNERPDYYGRDRRDYGPRGGPPRNYGPRDGPPRNFGPRDFRQGPMDGPRPFGPGPMGGPRDFGPGPMDGPPRGPGPYGPNWDGPYGQGDQGGMGPGPYGQGNYGQQGPRPPFGPGGGPMGGGPQGPGPMGGPQGGGPMGPGFGPPQGPGGYPDNYGSGPPMQGPGPMYPQGPMPPFQPPSDSFPPGQPGPGGFGMPPTSQQQTFSGEVFQGPGGQAAFTPPVPPFPAPQLPPTMEPSLPAAESAEQLIAQGMNPDLAKILEAGSNRSGQDFIPKEKSKKKKKKGKTQTAEESMYMEDAPAGPMFPTSIPLPEDVPLPPEPKKKKKKKKDKDKDLQNVVFPPLPVVEGPAMKPDSPMPQQSGPDAATTQSDAMVPPQPSATAEDTQSQEIPQQSVSAIHQAPQMYKPPISVSAEPQMYNAPPVQQPGGWQPVSTMQAPPHMIQQPPQPARPDGQPAAPGQPFGAPNTTQPYAPSTPGQPFSAAIASQYQQFMSQAAPVSTQIPQNTQAVPPAMTSQQQGMPPQQPFIPQTTQASGQPGQASQFPGMPNAPIPPSQSQQQLLLGQSPQPVPVPVAPVRRSRFDLNWNPDQQNVPVPPPTMIQQPQLATNVHQPAGASTPQPVMQQQAPMPAVSQPFQGQAQMTSETVTVEAQAVPSADMCTQPPSVEPPVANIAEDGMVPQPSLRTQPGVESMDTQQSFTAQETPSSDKIAEGQQSETSMATDDEDQSAYIYYENKISNDETSQSELQARAEGPKEPVTASQLLEKFKQRQQKKTNGKPDLSKFPVVLPTPITKQVGKEENKAAETKGQGKFTFAIRKLKQLEAEQEEEEKQVLTLMPTESVETKPAVPVDQGTDEKKSKKSKDNEESKAEKFSRRSRSRSASKEKRKSKLSRDRSKERSKSRDRDRKTSSRRSRSRDRKSRSRSRSRDRSKRDKEKSLSPWRKDREFFRRYGRYPRPGESDGITKETVGTRDRDRERSRSRDRARGGRSSRRSRDRDRKSSRDRYSKDRDEKSRDRRERSRDKSKERRSRDRKSRDSRERERESRRSIDKDSRERPSKDRRDDDSPDRSKTRDDKSEERDARRESRELDSRERKSKKKTKDVPSKDKGSDDDYKQTKSSKKKKKSKKYESSSEDQSSSDSEEEMAKLSKKQQKESVNRERSSKPANDESENMNVEYTVQVKPEPFDKSPEKIKAAPDVDTFHTTRARSQDKMESSDGREEGEVSDNSQPELPMAKEEPMETSEPPVQEVEDKKREDNVKMEDSSDENHYEKQRHFQENVSEREVRIESKKDRREQEDRSRRRREDNEEISDRRPRDERSSRKAYSRDEEEEDVVRKDHRREERQYEYKEEARRSRRGRDDPSEDEKDYYREKSSRRRDDRARRNRSDEEYVDPIKQAAKSKWDSGSESEDGHSNYQIEELLPRKQSSERKSQKEAARVSTSKSLDKIDIDISKINQMKLLDKIKKQKKVAASGSESSAEDVDERRQSRKADKKKGKKDKAKKYDDSESEEDSPEKSKKKKKIKKKKKEREDLSEEEVETTRKAKKKKAKQQYSDESEQSDVEDRGSKRRSLKGSERGGKKKFKHEDSEDSEDDRRGRKTKTKQVSDSDEEYSKPKKGKAGKGKRYEDSDSDEGGNRRKTSKSRKYQNDSEDEVKKKSKDRKKSKYDESEEETVEKHASKKKGKVRRVNDESDDDYGDYERKGKKGKKNKEARKGEESSEEDRKKKSQKKQRKYSDDFDEKPRRKGKQRYDDSEEDEPTLRRKQRSLEKSRRDSDEYEEERKPSKKGKGRRQDDDSDVEMRSRKDKRRKHESSEERVWVEAKPTRKSTKSRSVSVESKTRKHVSKYSDSEGEERVVHKKVKDLREFSEDRKSASSKRSKSGDRDKYMEEPVKVKRSRGSVSRSRSNSRSRDSKSNRKKQKRYTPSDSESDEYRSRDRVVKVSREPASSDDGRRSKSSYKKEKGKRKDARDSSLSPEGQKKDVRHRREASVDSEDDRTEKAKKGRRIMDERYDDDYRSRKKREVDKEARRKYSTSSSDQSSDSSSSEAGSGSDSDEARRKTKKTGPKNVQAGTSLEMGLVPGTPLINKDDIKEEVDEDNVRTSASKDDKQKDLKETSTEISEKGKKSKKKNKDKKKKAKKKKKKQKQSEEASPKDTNQLSDNGDEPSRLSKDKTKVLATEAKDSKDKRKSLDKIAPEKPAQAPLISHKMKALVTDYESPTDSDSNAKFPDFKEVDQDNMKGSGSESFLFDESNKESKRKKVKEEPLVIGVKEPKTQKNVVQSKDDNEIKENEKFEANSKVQEEDLSAPYDPFEGMDIDSDDDTSAVKVQSTDKTPVSSSDATPTTSGHLTVTSTIASASTTATQVLPTIGAAVAMKFPLQQSTKLYGQQTVGVSPLFPVVATKGQSGLSLVPPIAQPMTNLGQGPLGQPITQPLLGLDQSVAVQSSATPVPDHKLSSDQTKLSTDNKQKLESSVDSKIDSKNVVIKTIIPKKGSEGLKKSKSRWDTSQEKGKEDMYDPFAVGSSPESSPERITKNQPKLESDKISREKGSKTSDVQENTTKVKKETRESKEEKTIKEQEKKSETIQTVAQVTDPAPIPTSKPFGALAEQKDAEPEKKAGSQGKITMKFGVGRKLIGKSAIAQEDAEETEERDEISQMPKLKLAKPTEDFDILLTMSQYALPDTEPIEMVTIPQVQQPVKPLSRSKSKEKEQKRSPERSSRSRSPSRDRRRRVRSGSKDRSQSAERKLRSRSRSRDRKRRSISRDRKRSTSRERKRSTSRDRKRSTSRDRKRSTSRDRKRSTSRHRDKKRSTSRERRRRSRSKLSDRRRRSTSRSRRSNSRERRRRSTSRDRRTTGSRRRNRTRSRERSASRERRQRSRSRDKSPRRTRDKTGSLKERKEKSVDEKRDKRSQDSSVSRGSQGKSSDRNKDEDNEPKDGSFSRVDKEDKYSKEDDMQTDKYKTGRSQSPERMERSRRNRKSRRSRERSAERQRESSSSSSSGSSSDSSDSETPDPPVLSIEAATRKEVSEKLDRRKKMSIPDERPTESVPLSKVLDSKKLESEATSSSENSMEPPDLDMIVEGAKQLEDDDGKKRTKETVPFSPSPSKERSNLFEKFSPEKILKPTNESPPTQEDSKGSWERTPKGLLKYSPKKPSPEALEPIAKLFDVSFGQKSAKPTLELSEELGKGATESSEVDIPHEGADGSGDTNSPPKKRLTRRQAAEANVVLPEVMSKTMPTRSRRQRNLSQDSSDSSQSENTTSRSGSRRRKPSQDEMSHTETQSSKNTEEITLPKGSKETVSVSKQSSLDESVSSVEDVDISQEVKELKPVKRPKLEAVKMPSPSRSDTKIQEIPMPPSAMDENKNPLLGMESKLKCDRKQEDVVLVEPDSQSMDVVDMELDDSNSPKSIEIIENIPPTVPESQKSDVIEVTKSQNQGLKVIEKAKTDETRKMLKETLKKEIKGFSMKFAPIMLKKPTALEDVFETGKDTSSKSKLPPLGKVSPLPFGPPKFNIQPDASANVITTAVATSSLRQIPLQNIPSTSAEDNQEKAREVETIGARSFVERPTVHPITTSADVHAEQPVMQPSSLDTSAVADLSTPVASQSSESHLKHSHISPEQIGKAIQVICQENLSRIEVLQRERAKYMQGQPGQTADSQPEQPILQIDSTTEVSTTDESELAKLEKDREELMHMLQTQDQQPDVPPEMYPAQHADVQQESHGRVQEKTGVRRDYGSDISSESEDERGRGKRRDSRRRSDEYSRDRRDDHDDRRRRDRDRKRSRDRTRDDSRDRNVDSRDSGRDRPRERSRERDRDRYSERGRSRDRSRERSRERRHSRRGRDDDRHARRRSRSRERRSRSRDRRSRSWDRGGRDRDRRSRSRGRGRRSRSRDRRSRSRDRRSRSRGRRSRSRDRHRRRGSRSRSRDRRSRSRERDYKRHKDGKKDSKTKESALEKFEKELAEKKKLVQQSAAPTTAHQAPALEQGPAGVGYVDGQPPYLMPGDPNAVHFLPQPFPVQQQPLQQGFPAVPHPGMMDPQQFPPGFPIDPNTGMMQHPQGPGFFQDPMQAMGPGPMPGPGPQFQGGPGFPPGMYPPDFMQQGPPLGPDGMPMPMGPPGQGYMGPEHEYQQQQEYSEDYSYNDRGHGFGRKSGNRRHSEPYHERYEQQQPESDEACSFKKGIGGPGMPGFPVVKAKPLRTLSADSKPTETAEKDKSAVDGQKQKQDDKVESTTADIDTVKVSKRTRTRFSDWEPSDSLPQPESQFPVAEMERDKMLGRERSKDTQNVSLESFIVKTEVKEEEPPMAPAAMMTPPGVSEESDTDTGTPGKPIKVKSRWRRASEAETPPPPPPPSKVKVTDEAEGQRSDVAGSGAEGDETAGKTEDKPAEEEDDGEIPINFDLIDENIYLAERKRSKQMREVRRMVCDCTTCREDRDMGYEACGEDCLNRMLFIECGSKCPCGDYCMNKRFQRRLNANVTPFRTTWKGYGLKALDDLQPGQFVMEYVGEVLDYPMFKKRSKQYSKAGQEHFYFMAINPEEIVDATYKGNVSRFINHSCDPNCETQKWTVNGSLRVGFFVRKPIKKDEEITFDYKYEVYGREAQKCYCGTSICRGWLGGDKKMELRSSRRSASTEEVEKKKKELFDDKDKLDEEIERISELETGLRNKNDVLNICRLMVRAEDPEHRTQILKVLETTTESACLRLFLDYHGLPLVWCWMADIKQAVNDLKISILKMLKKLPITNRTILVDSKILDIVTKWAEPVEGMESLDISMAESIETADNTDNTDNTEDDGEMLATPPAPSNKNPVSILASLRDKKVVKKSVKFADVESSSDSESRASESEVPTESTDTDVSSSSQPNKKKRVYGLRRRVLAKDGPLLKLSDVVKDEPEGEVTQSADADSSTGQPGEETPGDEDTDKSTDADQGKDDSTVEVSAESSDKVEDIETDPVATSEQREATGDQEKTIEDDEQGETSEKQGGITEKESEELEMIVKAAEIRNMALALLEHWSGLKELYKIPKKQVLEERKRTERELDTNYKKFARLDIYKKKVSGWDTDKSRKRKREPSYKDDTDDSDTGIGRKSNLITPPRMSKSERRQLFEAQVKAKDEMAAEFQRQQEQYQQQRIEQMQQEQIIQQQNQRQLMQDPAFWHYATQDPNFLPSIGIDPQAFLQQLASDPVLLQQLMQTIPNFPQQLEHLTLMYQQVLQASQLEVGQPVQFDLPPAAEVGDSEPMTEQHLAFLQQVEAFKQQHLDPNHSGASVTMPAKAEKEEDIPPPPSPPKGKAIVLPPNWKTAHDAEGKLYYYHTVTRQTQWDPPNLDTGEHTDDMDLGTPTQDDTTKQEQEKLEEEREKPTTAAADTSGEVSRKLKEHFKSKMSSWIVMCLNPFRKADCKLGKINKTEDFKHLARKLTHHVMAKELKHCRHVEDLEVNENVKSKAKDFVRKYMVKFGATYKRSGNSPNYD